MSEYINIEGDGSSKIGQMLNAQKQRTADVIDTGKSAIHKSLLNDLHVLGIGPKDLENVQPNLPNKEYENEK